MLGVVSAGAVEGAIETVGTLDGLSDGVSEGEVLMVGATVGLGVTGSCALGTQPQLSPPVNTLKALQLSLGTIPSRERCSNLSHVNWPWIGIVITSLGFV